MTVIIESQTGTHVIFWHNVYLKTVRHIGGAPGPLSRLGAMMHIAIFDTVNHLTEGAPFESYLPLPDGADRDGVDPVRALYYAARYVLASGTAEMHNLASAGYVSMQSAHCVNPNFDAETFINEELNRAQFAPLESDEKNRAFGQAIAKQLIEERAGDGSENANDFPDIPFPFDIGDWRPTEEGPMGMAVTPRWGLVDSFGGWSRKQIKDFLPTSLPFDNISETLSSSKYADNFNEVKKVGRFDAEQQGNRTKEQTFVGFFWANDLDGTYKPPGQLYDITRIVAEDQGTVNGEMGLLRTAREFALVGIAMADAAIVAWYVKYFWPDGTNPGHLIRLWRPQSAIPLAAKDGNKATDPDPEWLPLSRRPDDSRFSPAFPAYISGHATFGGAHAAVMERLYGDKVHFTATTDDPSLPEGTTRDFESFSQAAREDADSRLYLGVHYRWDADGGLESGGKVGRYAFENKLQERA